MTPQISIILPAYNAEQYLSVAIESILKQTFYDFEFIIINDGSSDNTENIILSYKEPRIRYIKNEQNLKLIKTLNKGIDLARGKYIARMDADDYCSSDRLESELQELNDRELDVIGCGMNLFDNESVWGNVTYPLDIEKKDFLFNSPISHPTVLGNSQAFKELYCEKKYCYRTEDYDFFMDLYSKGYKLGNSQNLFYYFREDDSAASRRKFKYRFNEFAVRFVGYRKLKMLFPLGIFYCFKPLLIALLPKSLYKKFKRRRFNNK